MMDRDALRYLEEWRERGNRKPLVVRGARQVGKSYLVRQFGESQFEGLVEVNFENEDVVASYFDNSDCAATVRLLEAHYRTEIRPGKTLLFLDEIQAAPEVFARLRYFHEQMPNLHVAAAGSLLEFVLEEHAFSMPVGRVEYLHLGPMQFAEFVRAVGDQGLLDICAERQATDALPLGIHQRLVERFKSFLLVGGMPEALAAFVESGAHRLPDMVLQSILQTFADDFGKYQGRANRNHLLTTYRALPQLIGRKLKYVNISREHRAADLAGALHMLELARVAYLVRCTAAQGLPLGAQESAKAFKPLFLDVGLVLSALGLNAADLAGCDLMAINSGAICEQFVGQHLLHRQELYRQPELHYWAREYRSAAAEVDYVLAIGSHVIPVEVKAGKTGTMRSLHQFMLTHDSPLAVRLNLDLPSLGQVEGHTATGEHYSYPLLSLPVYMVDQIERFVREVLA